MFARVREPAKAPSDTMARSKGADPKRAGLVSRSAARRWTPTLGAGQAGPPRSMEQMHAAADAHFGKLADQTEHPAVAAARASSPGSDSGSSGACLSPTLHSLGICDGGKALPHQPALQRAFGRHSLAGVRAHIGPSDGADVATLQLNAKAFAHGEEVVFRSHPDLASAAHEATHVLQQRAGVSAEEARRADSPSERTAALVANRVAAGKGAEDVLDASLGTRRSGAQPVFQLQAATVPQGPSIQDAMLGVAAWTRTLAEQAMAAYAGLSSSQRDAWLQRHKTVEAMLGALDPADATGSGRFVATIRDILERVQQAGALRFAGRLGLQGEPGMATVDANFMHRRNVAAAKAAAGGHAPSASAVAAEQAGQVASTSIAPQTVTMTPQQAALINSQNQALIPGLIQYAAQHHPQLHLQASQIQVDAKAINDRGQGIIAFASGGKAVVGESFRDAAQANFAYVMPTLVHELFGHPDYGPYGTEYGLKVYDAAAAKMPGYVQPTGAGRTSEVDAYAYQETEIFSLLREVDYYVPVTAAHQNLASVNYDPAPEIANRMGLIKTQFERRVALSLVRGLALRIHADPRLSAKAKKTFDAAVKKAFPGEAALLIQ
jgi:hypothetical protein